jgi:hypothetical protein
MLALQVIAGPITVSFVVRGPVRSAASRCRRPLPQNLRIFFRGKKVQGVQSPKRNPSAAPHKASHSVDVADMLRSFYKAEPALESPGSQKCRWQYKSAVRANKTCFAHFS